MDSLLGIGIAGGGTSKGEGKALASRLTQMRKERNERAKTTAVATKKEMMAASSSPGIGGPAGQMTLQGLEAIGDADFDMSEMELVAPDGSGVSSRTGKGKNNNKKKKKRKKKK